jgi:hypothetical protein
MAGRVTPRAERADGVIVAGGVPAMSEPPTAMMYGLSAGLPTRVAVEPSLPTETTTTMPARQAPSGLLTHNAVPATALTLEITESTLMADPDGSLVTLDRLRRLGIESPSTTSAPATPPSAGYANYPSTK